MDDENIDTPTAATVFRRALDTTQTALNQPDDATDQATRSQLTGMNATVALRGVSVPVDESTYGLVEEWAVAQQRQQGTDPIKEYIACLQSLCNTCGGTWVDDKVGQAAGCHFGTNIGAAVYAASAWSCMPTGLIKAIIA